MSSASDAAPPPAGSRRAEPFDLSEALALRGWALGVLSGGRGGGEAPPPASPASWRAFLAVEQCALLLRTRPGGVSLPPGAGRVLDAFATADQQRFLSAAATARLLARWASGSGVRVVVLKSGVAAAEGAPRVGMADLDVLVEAGAAPELEAHLKGAAGYRADALVEHRLAGRHHGAPLHTGGMVAVEVHRALKGIGPPAALLERAVPLASVPGLFRLAPADHLFYQLLHGVVQHPERCGSLKDLALLAHGWRAGAPGEREEVLARAAAHPEARVLSAMLEMVEAAADGRGAADPLRGRAVGRYLMYDQLLRWRPPQAMARIYMAAAFALQGSGGGYRRVLREELAGGLPWDAGAWTRSPAARPLVRASALLLRASRLALVSALAVPYLAQVRRALRRARALP